MGLLLYICCIFTEQIFEWKIWGIASENNSFIQIKCKFCLHKLKWKNYKSFSNYLLACNLQKSELQIIIAGQQSVLHYILFTKSNDEVPKTNIIFNSAAKLFLHMGNPIFWHYLRYRDILPLEKLIFFQFFWQNNL